MMRKKSPYNGEGFFRYWSTSLDSIPVRWDILSALTAASCSGKAEPDVDSEPSSSREPQTATDSGVPETTTAGVDKAGVTAGTLLVAVWLAAVNYWRTTSRGV